MTKRNFVLAALGILLAHPAISDNAPWPDEQWPTASAAEQGVDEDVLRQIVADIRRGEYGRVDQFALVRNGYLIADHRFEQAYDQVELSASESAIHNADRPGYQYNYVDPLWHPYYRDTELHTLQSVTKSVLSVALGIAIDRGHIDGVDVAAMDFFRDYSHDMTDARKQAMSIRNLLTMRSGISWITEGGYDAAEHSTGLLENSKEWIQFILDRPMDAEPGTVYEYNDGASVLLGKIISEATGVRVDQWTEKHLFAPIGIENYYWKITPDEEVDTEGGLYLSTHDLARIGYLFLRNGKWKDKQIISADWVEASTSVLAVVSEPDDSGHGTGYGYQWWVRTDADNNSLYYMGNGYGGQFLIVHPAYDLVAVFNGWNIHGGDYRSTMRVVEELIVPAISDTR